MQKPRVSLERVLIGLLLVLTVALCLFLALPYWLVVDEAPGKVNAIVVLGGGGGDRLNQGLKLQADNLADARAIMDEGLDRPGFMGCKPERDGRWGSYNFRDKLQRQSRDGTWLDVVD